MSLLRLQLVTARNYTQAHLCICSTDSIYLFCLLHPCEIPVSYSLVLIFVVLTIILICSINTVLQLYSEIWERSEENQFRWGKKNKLSDCEIITQTVCFQHSSQYTDQLPVSTLTYRTCRSYAVLLFSQISTIKFGEYNKQIS